MGSISTYYGWRNRQGRDSRPPLVYDTNMISPRDLTIEQLAKIAEKASREAGREARAAGLEVAAFERTDAGKNVAKGGHSPKRKPAQHKRDEVA